MDSFNNENRKWTKKKNRMVMKQNSENIDNGLYVPRTTSIGNNLIDWLIDWGHMQQCFKKNTIK